jgi:hypothetical protein
MKETLQIIYSCIRKVNEWNVDGSFSTREQRNGITPGGVGVDNDNGPRFGYTAKEG